MLEYLTINLPHCLATEHHDCANYCTVPMTMSVV